MVREHTEKVKPPRALFVPFAFGRPLGEPDDPAGQHAVLAAALALFQAPSGPLLADFPDPTDPGADLNLPQAASVALAAPPADVAFEVTTLRPYYEQWLAAHDGRTAVGLSGVDQRRFRGVVRLFEAYVAGDPAAADLPERPADAPLPQFLRWCADDLKAFYTEARMAQKPAATMQELNTWLWGETALGGLLRAVRDKLKGAGDPAADAAAFGIAR